MRNFSDENQQRKSPKERFLLVIGFLFFLVYLALGLIIIFWKKFPIEMDTPYRIAFGVLLIVYSFFRFMRFFKTDNQ
jgi:uncharacterized membrane protein (DUF485 family)